MLFDQQPFLVYRSRRDLRDQRPDLVPEDGHVIAPPVVIVKFGQCLLQRLPIYGLQEVVHAMDFERLQGVLVVGGRKNDRSLHDGLPEDIKADAV